MQKVVTYLAVGYILWNLLSNELGKRVGVVGGKINFRGFSPTGINAEVFLRLKNNTPAGVTVENVAGTAFQGVNKLAEFSSINPFQVQPNAENAIPLNLTIPYQGVSSAVVSAIQTGQIQGVNVSGKLMLSGSPVAIPFSTTLTVL